MTYDKILMDEIFLSLMKEKDEKSSSYWEKIIADNPEIKKEFDKAKILYKILTSHKKVKYPDSIKQKSVNRLVNLIDAGDRVLNRKKDKYSISYISKLVASAAVIIGLSWFLASKLNIFKGPVRNAYHEVIVPSGEKSQVFLSDGTKIWLNSESNLRYPDKYKKSKRAVFLEGEGYFDVSELNGSNFTVYTQDIKVEALGTIFNIKSYPGDRTIETTLVEGSVKVGPSSNENIFTNVILKPNERFVYRKYAGADSKSDIADNRDKKSIMQSMVPVQRITVNKVNTENVTCWKDHLLVFDNETFEEIAVKMSRWYKLKVNILDNDLKRHRFTGKFINNETVFNVLEAIDLTTPIEYTLINNEVNIDLDKTRQKSREYK